MGGLSLRQERDRYISVLNKANCRVRIKRIRSQTEQERWRKEQEYKRHMQNQIYWGRV
jgi:hypothetical protein